MPRANELRAAIDRCKARVTYAEKELEIDRYGERLIDCIECNRWSGNQSAFVVELSVEDFDAIRKLEASGRQASSPERRW
jgi:hypothetical protein